VLRNPLTTSYLTLRTAPRSDIERVTPENAAIQAQLQSGRADYGAVSPNNY